MDKQIIEKEMKRILLEIELSKFDLDKSKKLKEEYNQLKKSYTQILLEEKKLENKIAVVTV